MSSFDRIYTPPGYTSSYPKLLRSLYNINDLLKQDGISAPSSDSYANTMKLYQSFDCPLDKLATIHVGGTNGKGSTSFKISEALRLSGMKTGLFVSPHIASYRERIQVNGQLMTEHDVLEHLPRVLQRCVELTIPATLFEITFILGCLVYESYQCEAVVLEVGLGGELDATNVVSTALSIICSVFDAYVSHIVALDHTRVLGNTVEAIAEKKAGIFKHHKCALVGPQVPMHTMREKATQLGAHLYTIEEALNTISPDSLPNFIPSIFKQVGNTDLTSLSLSSLIEDTDVLNTRLSLAAICLLKQQPPIGDKNDTNHTTRNTEERMKDIFTKFQQINLKDRLFLQGLCSRTVCRWEKYILHIQLGTESVSADTCTNPSAEDDNPRTSKQPKLDHSDIVHKVDTKTTLELFKKYPHMQIKQCTRKANQGSHVFIEESINNTSNSSSSNSSNSSSRIGDSVIEPISHTNSSSSSSQHLVNECEQHHASSKYSENTEIEVVFDVGHNPAAIQALVHRIHSEYIQQQQQSTSTVNNNETDVEWNIRMIYGVSRDKDATSCLSTILTVIPSQHIHFAQSTSFRALPIPQLQSLFHQLTKGESMHPIQSSDIKELMRQVVQLSAIEQLQLHPLTTTTHTSSSTISAATTTTTTNAIRKKKSVIIVCGTGFIIPDVRAAIGIIEPRDSEDFSKLN